MLWLPPVNLAEETVYKEPGLRYLRLDSFFYFIRSKIPNGGSSYHGHGGTIDDGVSYSRARWLFSLVLYAEINIMGINIAFSLYYYVRVLVPLYLGPSTVVKGLHREPIGLRIALLLLGLGMVISGVFPQVWVAFAEHSSSLFMMGMLP